MNAELRRLLGEAAAADGQHRMDYRDPTARHGAEAVAALEPWVSDSRLWRFALRAIAAAARYGAAREASAALSRALKSADPEVRADAKALLGSLGQVPRGGKADPGLHGSPAAALEELRGIVARWRDEGSPPQGAVDWRKQAWVDAFPDHAPELKKVPRMLDRATVQRCVRDAGRDGHSAEVALLVVKGWGERGNGYGPTRARESLDLTEEPGERLRLAVETLRAGGAGRAYEAMSDGGPCRIHNLGSAFGTKFLYFCQDPRQRPRALILDKQVADWLGAQAGLEFPESAWSPERYRAYLSQMHTWAGELGCEPDDVELGIFRANLPPDNPWKRV